MFSGGNDPFEHQPLVIAVLSSPVKFFVQTLHNLIGRLRCDPRAFNPAIRAVCISDTHSKTASIPDGDLLIHAGDLSDSGTRRDIQEQIDWLHSFPHRHKVCIAGNHDTWLDPRSRAHLPCADSKVESKIEKLDWKDVIYLQHSSVSLYFADNGGRTLNIYGAPQIPACGGPHFAFQYSRGQDAWSGTVPLATHVLVTHTPPQYHLDLPVSLGCKYLLQELSRVRPKLHVFGHVHAGRGRKTIYWDSAELAYEEACRLSEGWLFGALDPFLWWAVLAILVHGASGLLWTALWRGRQQRTYLVNASLTYNNTGKLSNPPQVVYL